MVYLDTYCTGKSSITLGVWGNIEMADTHGSTKTGNQESENGNGITESQKQKLNTESMKQGSKQLI